MADVKSMAARGVRAVSAETKKSRLAPLTAGENIKEKQVRKKIRLRKFSNRIVDFIVTQLGRGQNVRIYV